MNTEPKSTDGSDNIFVDIFKTTFDLFLYRNNRQVNFTWIDLLKAIDDFSITPLNQ